VWLPYFINCVVIYETGRVGTRPLLPC